MIKELLNVLRYLRTLVEEYLIGPYENRSAIGSIAIRIVHSRLWERIFLSYILLNCILKLTWKRNIDCSYEDLLNEFALWACVVFTSEWLVELMAFGAKTFFGDGWYITDTVVNVFNWGSYAARMGYLPDWISIIFPNIAFIRMLRFLKPLGRVKALFASKVVVKTVAHAIGSMGPVLSLVGFFVLLFGIVGVNLFGRKGLLLYSCGLPLSFEDADLVLTPNADMTSANCTVNMDSYSQYVNSSDPSLAILRDLTVNGTERLCVSVTPRKYCRCTPDPNNLDVLPYVCVDEYGQCAVSSSICYRGTVYPVSDLHSFANFGKAVLAVTAFLYLKSWTDYMDAAVICAGAAFGYIYFFLLVIFGSFCLLNLTVATVSDAYSKMKKLSEAKRKVKEEERLEKERKELEREEMKKQADIDKKQGEGVENEEVIILFERALTVRLWLLGIFGFPCLHRIYLKTWYQGRWFFIRILTCNYFLVGWLKDGIRMQDLLEEASIKENQRREEYVRNLEKEKERIELLLPKNEHLANGSSSLLSLRICRAISYVIAFPLEVTAAAQSIAYLSKKIDEAQGYQSKDEKNEEDILEVDPSDVPGEESASNKKSTVKSKQSFFANWSQSLFAWVSDSVVLLNAASLALQGFDPAWSTLISSVGFFATAYFIIESILKSISYGGFSYYIIDNSNKFDFFLVVVPTIGELSCQFTKAMPFTNYREDYIYPMLVLRALRVLRILKLTRHLKGLQNLARRAFGSPAGVIYAFAVTIVFIFIVALFGNELFKSSVTFASNRDDFQNILLAMKCMIEFIFGDNYYTDVETGWIEGNFVGILFFVTIYYVANYVVLRIFIAIILENFEFSEEKKICLQIQLFQRHQIRSNDLIDGRARPMSFQENLDRLKKQDLDEDRLNRDTELWTEILKQRAAEKGKQAGSEKKKMLWDVVIEAAEEPPKPIRPEQHSYFVDLLLRLQMYVRKALYQLVENQRFNLFIAAMIIFSVVIVIVDSPQEPIVDIDSNTRSFINLSLFALFTSEVMAKMYAYGVFSPSGVSARTVQFPEGKPAFFSNSEEGGWNALDAAFILIMFIDLPFIPLSTGNFKVIRIVRVVRPLTRISPQVKTLLASLFASFGSILHVMNLFFLLVLIFGLLGVQLFQGRLSSCNDASAAGFSTCVGTVYGGFPAVPCFNVPVVTCPIHINSSKIDNDAKQKSDRNISLNDKNVSLRLSLSDMGEVMNITNSTSLEAFDSPVMCSQEIGLFLGQAVLAPRVWDVPNENFENILRAMVSLMRLFALENMYVIYENLMDIPSDTNYVCSDGSDASNGCPPGQSVFVDSAGPQTNNMPQNALYGMFFIFIANAFISQLVIGVLIDNIRRQSGSALYTEAQRSWIATAVTLGRLSISAKPQEPDHEPRKSVYRALQSHLYENTLTSVVVMNIIWMTTEHEPRSPDYEPIIPYVENTFLGVYIVDMAVKMFAFGIVTWKFEDPKPVFMGTLRSLRIFFPYFRDRWNQFDFVIVLMAILDLSLTTVDLSFFKLLRVLRMFKLVSRVKVLQIMITTLLGATTSILAALLFLGIWVFVLGAIAADMMIFRNVKYGVQLSPSWNFKDLQHAMLLLFKIATGDGWFDLMFDTAVRPPFCTEAHLPVNEPWILSEFCSNSGDPLVLDTRCILRSTIITDTYIISDCGLGEVAWLYFTLFFLGAVFIFLPLFIATLIDYFTNPSVQVETLSYFNGEDCSKFADVWSEFDPNSEKGISIDNLQPFIERLHARNHRVGFNVSSDPARFKKIWTRIMSDPAYFPPEGFEVKGKFLHELNLDRIDRTTIVKGFGFGKRAGAIRDYLYNHCDFNSRRGKEVRFDYAAKVLCVYQTGILQPLTVPDLVNLGSSLQMFMGLIGNPEVKGDQGKENTKWQALNVHNQLQEKLAKGSSGQSSDNKTNEDGAATYEDLPKILQARSILLSDLYPKPVLGHEWKVKPTPTGEKRNELLQKIENMDLEFEKTVSRMIREILWGSGKSGSTSILDELLDGIFEGVATKYALDTCRRVGELLDRRQGRAEPQKRYSSAFGSNGPKEPIVSTVPRGWLNSQRTNIPRRRVQLEADRTGDTLSSLRRLDFQGAGLPRPTPPTRYDSLSRRSRPSAALTDALKAIRKNDTWRMCYTSAFGRPAAAESLESRGSWRSTYQEALRAVHLDGQVRDLTSNSIATMDLEVSRHPVLPTFGSLLAVCTAPRRT